MVKATILVTIAVLLAVMIVLAAIGAAVAWVLTPISILDGDEE